jgi:hypothetical protein
VHTARIFLGAVILTSPPSLASEIQGNLSTVTLLEDRITGTTGHGLEKRKDILVPFFVSLAFRFVGI